MEMRGKPLAIDLYSGLGGWTDGLLTEGFDVVGFDIERHVYDEHRYPAQLVLQDVRTIAGAQFADASLIVASSPCQEFSWRAMPWKMARALTPDEVGVSAPVWWTLPVAGKGPHMSDAQLVEWQQWQTEHPRPGPVLGLELFAQAFRIQAEAIAAAGHFIPMVAENVRGANKWVAERFGRSRWSFGSYHLWGDVPALMPITLGRTVMKQGIAHRSNGATNFHGHVKRSDEAVKVGMGAGWYHPDDPRHVPGLGFNTHADRQTRALSDHMKVGELNWRDHGKPGYKGDQLQDKANELAGVELFDQMDYAAFPALSDDSVKVGGTRGDDWFTHHNRPEFEERATKNSGGSWFNIAHNTESGKGQNPDGRPGNHGRDEAVAEMRDGVKGFTPDGQPLEKNVLARKHGSKSSARKAASARIAKIPLALARHIAMVYLPKAGS